MDNYERKIHPKSASWIWVKWTENSSALLSRWEEMNTICVNKRELVSNHLVLGFLVHNDRGWFVVVIATKLSLRLTTSARFAMFKNAIDTYNYKFWKDTLAWIVFVSIYCIFSFIVTVIDYKLRFSQVLQVKRKFFPSDLTIFRSEAKEHFLITFRRGTINWLEIKASPKTLR